jgi:hypothetical protein
VHALAQFEEVASGYLSFHKSTFAYYTATGRGALGALFIVAYAAVIWLFGRAILYVLAGH